MKTSVCATLDAPIDAVWVLVGDFANLPAWSPAVTGCTMEGAGVGAHRTIVTAAGEVRERLDAWDGGNHRIAYTPVSGSSLPLRGAHASIQLVAQEQHRTRVEWCIEGEPTSPPDQVEQLLRARYSARLGDLQRALVSAGQKR